MPAFFLSIPGVVATIGLVVLVVHGLAGARTPARTKTQITISLVVLATALYVVIARPEASDEHKWAYAIIGTTVTYWLVRSVRL